MRSQAPESGLVDQLEEAFERELGHDLRDDSTCPDAYLMRKPFKAGFVLGSIKDES